MKRLFVSAGLAAISAAALQSVIAEDATGPKYWSIGATLRGFYDSDYSLSTTEQGSYGIELLPTISFHAPLQQTDIGLRYTYGLYWYQDRQQLGVNPFDQTHQLDLWLDHAFNENWKGKVTDTFAVGQEPELLNPNPVTGVATPYRIDGDNLSNHGAVELDTAWTRQFSTVLTYNNGFYDYDNSGGVVNSSGMIFNGNNSGPSLAGILDRVEENVALDLQWHVSPDTIAFVGYSFAWVNYTGNEPIAVVPVANGNFIYHSSDRDSLSDYAYLGLTTDFTPNLTGSVHLGATYTDVYADPLFPSTDWSPYADVSLEYTYIPGSYVQLGFTHDISSTDQVTPNSSGNITQYAENSVLYLDVNHRITAKLMVTLIGRVQYTTYQGGFAGSDSQDTTDYGLGINLTYQFNPHFSVDAGYNYDDIVSDIVGYSYDRNRVYIGLTATY